MAARSNVAMRRWGSPAIVTLAAMAALTTLCADAAAKQPRPAPPTEACADNGRTIRFRSKSDSISSIRI
jgi:hypothetical protein